jgi:hypothetical protein
MTNPVRGKSKSGVGSASAGAWLLLGLVAGLVAVPKPATAQFLYRQLSFDYLVERAGIIVQGRVLEARYEPLPGYPNITTVRVTLQVERMLRGLEAETYTFRQYLLPMERHRSKPQYVAGQHLLLFLPRPSAAGLSTPLGGDQGLFRITRDAQGNEMVANAFGNARLFQSLPEAAAKAGVSLSPEELQAAAAERGPLKLDALVSLVRKFSARLGTE